MALLKVLLLLLELGVSVNSDVSLQKRIIGGQNCDDRERLYHVRLESSNGTHLSRCGGSLIHPQWILTAASCWTSETGWINRVMLKVHPRTVIRYSQVIRDDPVLYPYGNLHNNIILLKLRTPVTDVPLAQLPDCRQPIKLGNVVQLAGDGATTAGPNNQQLINAAIPSHLQCVDMNVIDASLFVPGHGFIFYVRNLNKNACYGDTGGGAVYNGKIYGVISIGVQDACQSPAAILDVCKYLWWIKLKTGLE